MSQTIQDIHKSIADADDLEEVELEEMSVADVFANLAQHPFQVFSRWNWKSALLGTLMRASVYLTVYSLSRDSWLVTLTAVFVEIAFRMITSGISGALIQSFRRATPAWLAMLIISISLPLFGHTVEFATHYIQETYFSTVFPSSTTGSRERAFAISVFVSVLSAMFNIYMMRNGVMLVGAGEETKSLWGDLKGIPYLVSEFTLFLPKQIIRFAKNSQLHYAIGSFVFFGFAVGTIFGLSRGKFSWAYATALGSWAILFGAIIVVMVVRVFVKLIKKFL